MHDPKRTLGFLSASFGLTWLAVTMLAAPGPAAWVALSGATTQAGVYFGIFSLSAASGAFLGGRAMERWGRRRALVGAHLIAAAGFAIAGVAFHIGSLPLFGLGTAIGAASIGCIYLTRLAAGEIFPAQERASAVARVQVSATAGAVLGPFLLPTLVPVGGALGVRTELLLWVVAPIAFLVASRLAARGHALLGPLTRESGASARVAEPIPRAPFVVALAALVCAQAAMVTVMGVTGVELRHAGHAATTTALVMALHFVGMFGLSLVVGRIADRTGRARTIATGLAILAVGGGTIAIWPGAAGLAIGLLLVGVGWSFAYIAGSVLLTDVIPLSRRARVMGSVDLVTAGLAATGSITGGLWYAREGIEGLGLAAAALVALPLVLSLVTRASPSPAKTPA